MVSGSKDNQQPVKLWDPKAGQGISTLYDIYTTLILSVYCVLIACADRMLFFSQSLLVNNVQCSMFTRGEIIYIYFLHTNML